MALFPDSKIFSTRGSGSLLGSRLVILPFLASVPFPVPMIPLALLGVSAQSGYVY